MDNNSQLIPYDDGRNSADALIAQAIDKNVSVESLERLLAMRKELKLEHAEEQYNQAMSMFQAECPTIKKTKSVVGRDGVVRYKFAPIESIVHQVKHLLEKHGFSYSVQTETDTTNRSVKAICTVKHILGHSEHSSFSVPTGEGTQLMSAPQVIAAALTFAKRYAFCNAFGILTGDTDNDAIAQRGEPETERKVTEKQQDFIAELFIQSDLNMEAVLKTYKVDDISQLTTKQGSNLISKLKGYIAKQKKGNEKKTDTT